MSQLLSSLEFFLLAELAIAKKKSVINIKLFLSRETLHTAHAYIFTPSHQHFQMNQLNNPINMVISYQTRGHEMHMRAAIMENLLAWT